MQNHSTPFSHFLGCDVSKAFITFFDSKTRHISTVPNTRADLKAFLKPYGSDCLAVCEPTGNHEALLLELADGKTPVHRADLMKVKSFIRSYGTLGKTDAIDARALAWYGAERWKTLALWTLPDKTQLQLRALVRRRDELVVMRTAETNRAHAPALPKQIIRGIQRMLRTIAQEIGRLDKAIQTLLASSSEISDTLKVMQTLRGIGELTATKLLVLLPELGRLPRKQITALAGLAPHPKESGQHKGYRKMRGGRKEIKRILFLPALVAIQHEKRLQEYYQRQLVEGKKKMSVICAVMAKIVTILNARIRDSLQKNQHSIQQS